MLKQEEVSLGGAYASEMYELVFLDSRGFAELGRG
jgi:hypothetical protein